MKVKMCYTVVLILALFLVSGRATGQSWDLTGNTGTNPSTNFLGTTDNRPLIFKTNNSEAIRINTNGNVGIRTPNPLSPLAVAGHISLIPNTSGQLLVGRYNSAFPYAYIIARSGTATEAAGMIFRTDDAAGGEWDRMTISSDGKVGIGTTNPSKELEVISKTVGGGIKVYGDASTGTHDSPGFDLEGKDIGGTNRKGGLGLALSNGHFSTNAAIGDLVLRSQDKSIHFSTQLSGGYPAKMTIKNNGNVGIGTNTPTQTLDVRGTGITFRHTDGNERAFLDTASGGQSGVVAALGPNGRLNAALITVQQNPNHGAVAVYDAAENAKAFMLVDVDGRGFVVADVKSFRVPNSKKSGTDIVYASIEGPEAAAYVRGTARLVDGKAVITFPDHFMAVASPKGMTVQLTPLSADSLGLGVVDKNLKGLVVKELHGGKGSYEFDWEVKAIRKGYEDYQVIQPHSKLVVDHFRK